MLMMGGLMKYPKMVIIAAFLLLLASCGQQSIPSVQTVEVTTRGFDTGLGLPFGVGESDWLIGGLHGPNGDDGKFTSLDFGKSDGSIGDIRAMADGDLVYNNSWCNGSIQINHPNGIKTFYVHVKFGTRRAEGPVQRGDIIGQTGYPQIDACGVGNVRHVHIDIFQSGAIPSVSPTDINGWDIGGWTIERGSIAYDGCITNIGNDSIAKGTRRCGYGLSMSIQNEGKIGTGRIIQPIENCNYAWNPGGGWTRQITDNDLDFSDGQGFEKLGLDYWWLDGGNGSGGNTLYTYSGNVPDQTYGKWSTYVPRGQYDVYGFIPNASGNNDGQGVGTNYADDVKYKVESFTGNVYNTAAINQSANRGCWVKLGSGYNWAQGDRVAVQLGDNVDGANLRRIYYDDIAYFRTARPIWTLSPNGLTLPAGTVGGTTSNATYTATNSGGLSGTGALSATNGFTVSQPGVGLGAGQAFNMTITAPACTVAGTLTSTITMSGDDASATMNVSRVCTAAPVVTWTVDANVVFAAGTVGGTTAPVPLTLTNTGNTAGNYTVGVTNGFTASPTSGSLAAGAKIIIDVTAPVCTSTANQTAEITFGGSSSASNNLTRGCIGVPIWTPSLTVRSLPDGIVGGTSSNAFLYLQNTGTASGTYNLSATNSFSVSPTTATVTNGSSILITVTAPVCTVAGTQTSVISIAGSTTTINASRVCTVPLLPIPAVPTGITLNVSSNGRIFASWNESTGADQYEFTGTFDTNALIFGSPVNARGSGIIGAVLVWGSTPEDPTKQGKQLCVQIRAKSTGGSSNYATSVCTTYKYYSGVSLRSSSPVVTISIP
jgi:hypothetical protein